MRRFAQLSAAVLLIAQASSAALRAQEKELSSAEIDQALNSPNSHVRNAAWKRLNAENPQHYKVILEIFKKLSWFDRDGAVEALAQAGTEESIKKLTGELKRNKHPFVRQGVAKALARMNDERVYPALFAALSDESPSVRREVVYALRIHKRNDSVDALVTQFQKEEDPVARSFYVNTLNDLTQAYRGPDPRAWLIWWEQAKNDKDYELGKVDEEAKKEAEELGRKLRSRTVVSLTGGVTLESVERGSGKGVPILIVPYYGYAKEIMLPFLSEIERQHKLYYIDLPPVSSFKNVKTVSAKQIPYYPVDQLVDAFEDLRKATGEEHFALMACGMNSWIALRYAERYPQSVAALVLVSPISGGKTFGEAVDRFISIGKKENDVEMHYFGLGHRFNSQTGESVLELEHTKKDSPLPRLEGEAGSIDRRSWSLFFKDERDSLISMLYPVKSKPLGGVAIPEFNALKDKPASRLPMLVFAGAGSLYTTVQDCQAIAKHYGGACLVYNSSANMPFSEESKSFTRDLLGFLKKFTKAKKAKEKDSKERDGAPAASDAPAKAQGKGGTKEVEAKP